MILSQPIQISWLPSLRSCRSGGKWHPSLPRHRHDDRKTVFDNVDREFLADGERGVRLAGCVPRGLVGATRATEVQVDRIRLRERIVLRTGKMLREGLIDEVTALERAYGRRPNPMKAIGITEVLGYLDGRYRYEKMKEKIITHTARLAKRQVTFNRSQFKSRHSGTLQELKSLLAIG